MRVSGLFMMMLDCFERERKKREIREAMLQSKTFQGRKRTVSLSLSIEGTKFLTISVIYPASLAPQNKRDRRVRRRLTKLKLASVSVKSIWQQLVRRESV